LVALPLPIARGTGGDYRKVVLPPFLPEEVILPEEDGTLGEEGEVSINQNKQSDAPSSDSDSANKDDWQSQLINWYKSAPKPNFNKSPGATINEWKRLRNFRQVELQIIRRNAIMEELIAYQALKRKADKDNKRGDDKLETKSSNNGEEANLPLGYALVTGASRGIGRAFAIQLARFEIPLILVARDLDKLKSLASDIKTCYNVPCYVINADLSRPDAALALYQTTRNAGLDVEILVNNAGIGTTGEFCSEDTTTIEKVLNVNTWSVATLTRLYGQDMKNRRRGRILTVSSVAAAFPGLPGSAIYAATKSFQKSLSCSIGKELEPYGVGVTCLMPGAIKGTSFRERSKMERAACWYFPFYTRTPSDVSKLGVRALLSGDGEATLGWQNRLFTRVMQPLLPQRISILISEFAWKPMHLQLPKLGWQTQTTQDISGTTQMSNNNNHSADDVSNVPSHPPPVLSSDDVSVDMDTPNEDVNAYDTAPYDANATVPANDDSTTTANDENVEETFEKGDEHTNITATNEEIVIKSDTKPGWTSRKELSLTLKRY